VYKLSKALYGLKQAPRAWYARLKIFLLEYEYVMGSVDKTLFTLKDVTDFLFVQICVHDIIFGGSSHTLVFRFQEMMKNEFQMSMMRELNFFLGIQVKQTKEDIFIHQAKYTKDLMKKFNMIELKPVSTPMSTAAVLDPDENGEAVDQREYKSMIGSLLYLTATRSDIQFTVCLVHAFRLFHALHIGRQFSKSSGISNTLLSLEFDILLVLHLILLVFLILTSRGVELTERALLVLIIFLNLHLYVGQLASSLLLHSPSQRPSM
jgi:isopentenyldiphosphate isomerase